MAVQFVARKCACGGRLEFNPEKKVWICAYCGTIVEREATFGRVQVDGLEGIGDVVRQTLMDVANNRLDHAAKSLADCERKEHQHIGTLLANLSYYLAKRLNAKSTEEAKSYLDRVRVCTERLNRDFPVIAEDEINLYETFGGDSADIYAFLYVVFDILNDRGRLEYISAKLKPQDVFSPYANRYLLRTSQRRGEYHLTEMVARNVNHIDRSDALREILRGYPDAAEKAELIQGLCDEPTARALPREFLSQYLRESLDAPRTKLQLLQNLSATGVKCDFGLTAAELIGNLDGYEKAKDFFEILEDKKEYLKPDVACAIALLKNSTLTVDEKIQMLEKFFPLLTDARAMDELCHYYLTETADESVGRRKLIDFLLNGKGQTSFLSVGTLRDYLLRTAVDGEIKPEIAEKLFAMGIRPTLLGDILSEYLLQSDDPETIRDAIIELLLKKGLRADSDELIQYLTESCDSPGVRVKNARRLIAGGTPLKVDALEQYLRSLTAPDLFSGELFDFFTEGRFTVSFEVFCKFLLFCRDTEKAKHCKKLIENFPGDLGTLQTKVKISGEAVSCNLPQAYFLTTLDDVGTARAVAEVFESAKIKWTRDIVVNGKMTKLKKYCLEHRSQLPEAASAICMETRAFSFLRGRKNSE
ncbi:MAG: hypothetical protein LUC98_01735 [Lachnospiraceae bacterium]|nr:hypothetical protein [Lachnospiraceae bacterium]